jgi:hypothetical protein
MQKIQLIPESIRVECQKLLKQPDGTEKMLAYLRENNFPIMQSIKALIEIKGISLGEAKEVVNLSETWKPELHLYDAFHAELETEVRRFE